LGDVRALGLPTANVVGESSEFLYAEGQADADGVVLRVVVVAVVALNCDACHVSVLGGWDERIAPAPVRVSGYAAAFSAIIMRLTNATSSSFSRGWVSSVASSSTLLWS